MAKVAAAAPSLPFLCPSDARVRIGSSQARLIAGRVALAHGIVEGSFVALHLRRGDAVAGCNTSIAAMIKVTNCAVHRLGLNHTRNFTVGIFTDEQDAQYRRSMRSALGKLPRVAQAFDGESALRDASVKAGDDNYIRFAASVELRKRAVYTIQQRRGWCVQC